MTGCWIPERSSEAMLFTILTRAAAKPRWQPHDADNLRRCIILLNQVPEARETLLLLAQESGKWRSLQQGWNLPDKSIQEEAGENLRGGKSPKAHAMMKRLLDEET